MLTWEVCRQWYLTHRGKIADLSFALIHGGAKKKIDLESPSLSVHSVLKLSALAANN